MSQWIDFKKLKASTDIRTVLDHYGVELKVKGDQATGFCPLPKHAGDGKSPSFSVKLSKGIFRCFGCGAKGNVIDLVALMEGLNPRSRDEFRAAALKLQSIVGGASLHRLPKQAARPQGSSILPVVINAPLDFELKGLDPTHTYLEDRGFTPETIEHFGLGYCSRGYHKGRIAIPLRSRRGVLIGYAGRLVDDKAISEDHPKYLFPAPREREGVRYEFQKSLFLCNAHSIESPVDDLVVVEGFASVWWLWQAGFSNTVALMGATVSEPQVGLISTLSQPDSVVRFIPDGDEAGERCAREFFEKVASYRKVKWIRLGAGKQPTDVPPADLQWLISTSC